MLVASHKLVRGLKEEINPSNTLPHNVTSVTNMLKLITECSSDAYLLINQPGLTYADLTTERKIIGHFKELLVYVINNCWIA